MDHQSHGYQYLIFLILLQITSFTNLFTSIGCMDISKHRDTSDGYDYKKLHYVHCSCPCKRYEHVGKKVRCTRCLHYHHPDDIYNF